MLARVHRHGFAEEQRCHVDVVDRDLRGRTSLHDDAHRRDARLEARLELLGFLARLLEDRGLAPLPWHPSNLERHIARLDQMSECKVSLHESHAGRRDLHELVRFLVGLERPLLLSVPRALLALIHEPARRLLLSRGRRGARVGHEGRGEEECQRGWKSPPRSHTRRRRPASTRASMAASPRAGAQRQRQRQAPSAQRPSRRVLRSQGSGRRRCRGRRLRAGPRRSPRSRRPWLRPPTWRSLRLWPSVAGRVV